MKSTIARPERTNLTKTSANRRAIEERLDREIQKHIGKWVAIAEGQIVTVGDSAREVWAAAKARGFSKPLILRAPLTSEESLYALEARAPVLP